jgi:outer membrane protein TolC
VALRGTCAAGVALTGLVAAVSAQSLLQSSGPVMKGRAAVDARELAIDISLGDAIYLGLRNNRAIRSAYLQRIAQKFDLRVARDKFTPKLELTSAYLANRTEQGNHRTTEITPLASVLAVTGARFSLSWSKQINVATEPGGGSSSNLSLSVIQPLLRDAGVGVNLASVRVARLDERAHLLGLQAAVSQSVTQIILAYREFLRAQEQVRIAQDALLRSRQLLDINRDLIEAGRMARFDSVQTEADVATQEFAVEEATNQLDAGRMMLLQLLALDLDTRVEASEGLDAHEFQIDVAQARRIALENAPEYLSQVAASQSADIDLKVARNQRLWDVSLVLGANYSRDDTRDGQTVVQPRGWDKYAGVQVSIPIGDLTRKQNEVHAAVNASDQQLQVDQARQALEQRVNDAVRDVSTRWRQYQIAGRARDLSARKLDIEREKLQVGRSSNFQVLSFEADLRNAASTRVNALISYLNALTLLDLQLGMTLRSWDVELND